MSRIGVNGMHVELGRRYGFFWLKKKPARFIHNHDGSEIDIATMRCNLCGKRAASQAIHCHAVRAVKNSGLYI